MRNTTFHMRIFNHLRARPLFCYFGTRWSLHYNGGTVFETSFQTVTTSPNHNILYIQSSVWGKAGKVLVKWDGCITISRKSSNVDSLSGWALDGSRPACEWRACWTWTTSWKVLRGSVWPSHPGTQESREKEVRWKPEEDARSLLCSLWVGQRMLHSVFRW